MSQRILLLFIGPALVTIVLSWGISPCRAESQPDSRSGGLSGPYRNEQNVMPMRRITNAQREEAAKRLQESRAAAERNAAASKAGGSGTKSPPKAKGGTNE